MYLCKSLQAFSETLEITSNLSEVCPEDLRNSPRHGLLPILRMAGHVLGNFYQIFFLGNFHRKSLPTLIASVSNLCNGLSFQGPLKPLKHHSTIH